MALVFRLLRIISIRGMTGRRNSTGRSVAETARPAYWPQVPVRKGSYAGQTGLRSARVRGIVNTAGPGDFQAPLALAASGKARAQGAQRVDGSQRRGALVDILLEVEPDTRLFVLGRDPDGRPPSRLLPDPHLEASVRALRRPVLVTQGNYRAPKHFLIAFDGSPTAIPWTWFAAAPC